MKHPFLTLSIATVLATISGLAFAASDHDYPLNMGQSRNQPTSVQQDRPIAANHHEHRLNTPHSHSQETPHDHDSERAAPPARSSQTPKAATGRHEHPLNKDHSHSLETPHDHDGERMPSFPIHGES